MSLRVPRHTFLRLIATLAVAIVGTVTALTFAPRVAFAESTSSMESEFIAKTNAAREANGLRPYSVASDLTAVAREHSREMAQKQELYHNPNLTTDVHNWQAVGENVGYGPTVDDIHTAFMNSPEHRSNILDHDFTQIGVGVTVDSSGRIWVTEDFREPYGATHTTTVSHTTTTHHATTSHTVSSTPRRTATPTRPATTPAPRHVAARPHPVVSPTARLFAKLTALRTQAAKATTSDPVAAAFDYLDNVTTLTTAA